MAAWSSLPFVVRPGGSVGFGKKGKRVFANPIIEIDGGRMHLATIRRRVGWVWIGPSIYYYLCAYT